MTWMFQPLLAAVAQSQAQAGATLAAEAASFSLQGQAAAFRRAAKLSAAPAFYTGESAAAAFRRALRLNAAPGLYATTGAAALLDEGGSPAGKDARTLDIGLSLGI